MNSFDYENNKITEMNKADLEPLKKWIAGKQKLTLLTENDLALFLQRNHYDLEKTKSNIDNYFSLRSKMSEYFEECDSHGFDALHNVSENVSVVILPKRTPEGYNIVLMQLLDSNPNHYDFNQAVKYLNMVVHTHVYEEGTNKNNGYLYICDMKDATPEHLDRLPAGGLKSFFEYLKNESHFRWKGMHYVNSSFNSETSEYLKSKIADIKLDENVQFHENLTDLGKAVPLELLPNEMGGSVGDLRELTLAQMKKIKDYRTWFKIEQRLKANEIKIDESTGNKLKKFSDKETSVY